MTAAAASEYEVPLHGVAPAEAIEAAEDGQVIYLTRAGRRIATLESAEQRLVRLQRIAEFWKQREQETAAACRDLWESVTGAGASSHTQQQVRALIDRMMEQV